MTLIADPQTIPEGWYPDHGDSSRLRWWNGEAWTGALTVQLTTGPVAVAEPPVSRRGAHAAPVSLPDVAPEAAAPSSPGAHAAEAPVDAISPIFAAAVVEEPVLPAPVAAAVAPEAAVPVAAVPVVPVPVTAVPFTPVPVPAAPIPVAPVPIVPAPVGVAPVKLALPIADYLGETREVRPVSPVVVTMSTVELLPSRGSVQRFSRGWADASHGDIRVSGGSNTGGAWFFALFPAIQLGIVWAVFDLWQLGEASQFRLALVLFTVLAYLVAAVSDRRALVRNGHEHLPHPALAFIPIAYLVARVVKLGAGAVAALVTWVLLQAAVAAALLLVLQPLAFSFVSDVLPAPTPPVAAAAPAALVPITPAERAAQLTPAGMSASVKAQMLSQKMGAPASVRCPNPPSVDDGAQVTCAVVLKGGLAINVVVMIDSTYQYAAERIVSVAPGN
ncbi:MAG: hypothetical protein QOI02_1449 [Actinomycetota bacterium]|nr:hypothetical protein [Actinomycetota bacterium]